MAQERVCISLFALICYNQPMEGMKHFNIGEANEKLIQKEEHVLAHDSVTPEQDRLASIQERGKMLLLEDLESQEFNLLTLQDTGTKEDIEKTFKTYSTLVHQYEEKYGPYKTQLSGKEDIARYIQKMEETAESRRIGRVATTKEEESLAA